MSAQLKVTCPGCGHVRVAAADVRIVENPPGKDSYYVFSCPDCGRRVRRTVSVDVLAELVARGVVAVRPVAGTGPPTIG